MIYGNFEEMLPYRILTVAVLLIFYAVYLTKMFVQKKHGIRTHQIGRRREKGLHTVEMLMSVATPGIVPAQLVSVCLGWSCLSSGARFTGFLIALIGDAIFLIAVFFMCCNILTGAFTALVVIMLHMQILQEERYMASTFGEEYLSYKKRVLRYLGRR